MATNYQVIKTGEELRKALEYLETQPTLGLDTETTDLDPYNARLRLIQLAAPDSVHIIDVDAFGNATFQIMKRSTRRDDCWQRHGR